MRFILLPLLVSAQITKPPEFQDDTRVKVGNAAATVDGTSHVSGERAALDDTLVSRLRALAGYAQGVKLIEGRLFGLAETYFEKRGLPIGVAVAQFLAGKTERSASELCALADKVPADSRLLPFLGETVGVEAAWAERMLAAIRRLDPERTAEGEFYLGIALLKQSPPRAGEAMAHLERSAALDRQGTRALLEAARQQTAAGRSEEAIDSLKEAVRRDDSIAAAHYRLGMLYRSAGQVELSKQHLRRFQELR